MSWSVNFIGRGKSHAKDLAHKASLPNIVHALIVDAIDGIAVSGDTLIAVEGHGHQAEGPSSFATSTCSLTVKPLIVSS